MQLKPASRTWRPMLLTLTALIVCAAAVSITSVHAALLPINNPGFEAFPLGFGSFSTHIGIPGGLLSGDPIPGWVLNGHGGTWRPDTFSYPTGAPEGVNVAFLEWDSIHSSVLSQVLADVLTVNTVYTLSVKVGHRADYNLAPFRVQLLAGGEVLSQGTLASIPAGQFQTVTVTFTVPADHPLLGLPLEIRLTADNADRQQVNFDDVKLDATPQ